MLCLPTLAGNTTTRRGWGTQIRGESRTENEVRTIPHLRIEMWGTQSLYGSERVAETVAETIYDVVVMGGGPAGYTAAIRGAEYGLKVALIDASPRLGGTCLHVGCIPTKALLFNAEIWEHVLDGAEFGIKIGEGGIGTPTLDWAAVLARKNAIITKHVKGLEFLMRKHKIAVIPGYARLTGPSQDGVHTVDVDKDGVKSQVKAKNVIVATGSAAKLLPGLQADQTILTNIEILEMSAPPKSLVVIGAGAVGVEFASIFRSFGTEVTILEFLPRMVPVEDEEIAKELARVFRKRESRPMLAPRWRRWKDRERRARELYRREWRSAGERSGKGAGGRGAVGADRGYRPRENED